MSAIILLLWMLSMTIVFCAKRSERWVRPVVVINTLSAVMGN